MKLHPHLDILSYILCFRCPFLFELDVAALVSAFCTVELRAHALSAALVITSRSERNRVAEVSDNDQYLRHVTAAAVGSIMAKLPVP